MHQVVHRYIFYGPFEWSILSLSPSSKIVLSNWSILSLLPPSQMKLWLVLSISSSISLPNATLWCVHSISSSSSPNATDWSILSFMDPTIPPHFAIPWKLWWCLGPMDLGRICQWKWRCNHGCFPPTVAIGSGSSRCMTPPERKRISMYMCVCVNVCLNMQKNWWDWNWRF